MRQSLGIACLLLVTGAALAAPTPPKHKHATVSVATSPKAATPAAQNQFIEVDEFTKSKLAPHTAVSVEGYIVIAYHTADGAVRLALVDAVDHVLSPKDAAGVASQGATAIVPAAQIKKDPHSAWTANGMERLVMYTGAGSPQKLLHDVPPKVRVTGWTAGGHAVINPVTKIEYQDENGDWKVL